MSIIIFPDELSNHPRNSVSSKEIKRKFFFSDSSVHTFRNMREMEWNNLS